MSGTEIAVTQGTARELIMSDNQISRRVVLTGTALALGAVASGVAATCASAQQKVSQADAKYQAQPKDGQQCEGCVQFQAPNACKLVDGNISPNGWCTLFAAKPK
jgi:High potential iron-sulfur protein